MVECDTIIMDGESSSDICCIIKLPMGYPVELNKLIEYQTDRAVG